MEIPRYTLAPFVCALSGCDFLTPFSSKIKPICKFCTKSPASWGHLLFNCPSTARTGLSKFEAFRASLSADTDVSDQLRPKLSKAKRIMASLWNQKDYVSLTDFCFGVSLHKYKLFYKTIVHRLVSTIAPIMHSIEQQWDSLL